MKCLQWTMTIPEEKQKDFIKWFKEFSGPILGGFGAIKHELFKVESKEIVGRQTAENNKFIERIYFNDIFEIPIYFEKVKQDPKAWKLSRMYEEKFGASDIELKVLKEVV